MSGGRGGGYLGILSVHMIGGGDNLKNMENCNQIYAQQRNYNEFLLLEGTDISETYSQHRRELKPHLKDESIFCFFLIESQV